MEMDSISIPNFFFELKKHNVFKNAVVAGGYLRDQCYGVSPKDIDIFFPITTEGKFASDFDAIWPKLEKDGWKFVDSKPTGLPWTDDKGYKHKPDLKVQYNFKVDDVDVDLMAMRMNIEGFMSNMIEDFPFSNQQIATDGKKVIESDGFTEDLRRHSMTLRKVDNQQDLPRMIEKFIQVRDRYAQRGRHIVFTSDYILTKRSGDDWL